MDTPDPILALETSTRRASVALRRGPEVFETELEHERAHASDLIPALDALFHRAGLVPGSPLPGGAILVGIGPGSYTGLRVGIATALGLVRALGVGIRGVPSLATLAFAELEEHEQGTVVLNARASEFYVACYRRTGDDVVPVQEPCVRRADDVRRLAENAQILLGDATVAEAARLPPEVAARMRTGAVPRAGALLALGRNRLRAQGPEPPAEVDALYLRPFTTPVRRP